MKTVVSKTKNHFCVKHTKIQMKTSVIEAYIAEKIRRK
jgi:hypothetical protein